jgi:hypothetical protein
MSNYQDGKIYKIHSFQTDNIYIGSTTQTLCRRFSNHKTTFKQGLSGLMSKEILKYDDSMITLIETYPCNDKNELEKRERYHIENNNCVNKRIPTRTSKEYTYSNKDKIKQQRKQRSIDNKDKIKKTQIQYRLNNKDKSKEYAKQYYNNNSDLIKQQTKQYRINNKETRTQKLKQYDKHRNSHFGIICKSYGIFN